MASRIYWTQQARDDLRCIRAHIARDAPVTALAYVRRLRESVERLRVHPMSGQIMDEFGRENIREIFQGSYRIIYRVSELRVDILNVFHGSKLLGSSD